MAHAGNIEIRPFAERDFEPLAELVRQVWESGLDEVTGTLAARLTLAAYLALHEWGLVAEHDGRLVGGILAGLRDTPGDGHWADVLESLEGQAAEIDPELPTRLLELAEVEVREAEVTRRLKESDAPQADAVIQLLILSPEARGRHLGSRLLDEALSWARSQGASGYFLMTDDECDVGFYDHLGIPRLETERIEYDDRPFHIYAYGGLLS